MQVTFFGTLFAIQMDTKMNQWVFALVSSVKWLKTGK